ncbi:MAG: F0F1 ATP synthase subunit A [Chloroflexi bacterium]|nr:F0F1 ATP synthase subunit A [Chloroflexota bacterium]
MSFLAARAYPPVLPHVQLPAEKISHSPLFTLPVIGEFYLTNTLLALLIADVIILLLAWSIHKQAKRGQQILTGIPGVFGAILEMLYGMTETTAGKWTKKIFPYFATIFMLVLIVNWMELIPGVDSIGILEPSEHGYPVEEIVPGIMTIVKSDNDEHSEAEGQAEPRYVLAPYVRVTATDLNFTVSLAFISVVMTQVIGFQTLGWGYITKYFNIHAFRNLGGALKKPGFGGPFEIMMPFIDIAVGLLEIIAEISKILSFSFRLFGNIFAGAVLLFVIGFIAPVFAQSIFLLLELFIGLIQAFVFGILTMVFMSMATQGHGDKVDEHAH